MKKIALGLIVIVGALWVTNPGMEDFTPFMQDVVEAKITESTGGGKLGKILGGGVSEIIGPSVERITRRDSYVVCSTYTVDINQDDNPEWRFFGVATTFFTLEEPEGGAPFGRQ